MGERITFPTNAGRLRPPRQVHDPATAADAWSKTMAFFRSELNA